MSNEYKRLKEELDSADLDSILPGFDREASWQELSPRLKKTRNNIYVWRYAAALVAIIIIAVMVRMQMNKSNVDEQVAKTVPTATAPVPVDTNTAKQPQVEPAAEPKPVVAVKKATRKAAPVQKMALPESQPLPVEEHIANTQPPPVQPEASDNVEQTVATVKPVIKRPRAVHLLDIDNENRQAVIQNRKELQGLSQRIVNLMPGRQYSNTDNDRKPSSLFRAN